MPKSTARKKPKKQNGQHASAGRFAINRAESERMALRLMGRGLLVACVALLASSTLSDPLQDLARDGLKDAMRFHNIEDASSYVQQERIALMRRTAADADAVRRLSTDELVLLFGEPTLKRRERQAESWHFTSADCALDVYFKHDAQDKLTAPVYAEYRLRGEARETGIMQSAKPLDHRACVRSLFSHAKNPQENEDDKMPGALSSTH